jgi:hypothetical protein
MKVRSVNKIHEKKGKGKAKLPLNFHASPITHKIELFDQSFYYEV